MTNIAILTLLAPWHVVLIILVIILLFGGKKIPELMKGIGEGIKEFKKATKDTSDDDKDKNKNSNTNIVQNSSNQDNKN